MSFRRRTSYPRIERLCLRRRPFRLGRRRLGLRQSPGQVKSQDRRRWESNSTSPTQQFQHICEATSYARVPPKGSGARRRSGVQAHNLALDCVSPSAFFVRSGAVVRGGRIFPGSTRGLRAGHGGLGSAKSTLRRFDPGLTRSAFSGFHPFSRQPGPVARFAGGSERSYAKMLGGRTSYRSSTTSGSGSAPPEKRVPISAKPAVGSVGVRHQKQRAGPFAR